MDKNFPNIKNRFQVFNYHINYYTKRNNKYHMVSRNNYYSKLYLQKINNIILSYAYFNIKSKQLKMCLKQQNFIKY